MLGMAVLASDALPTWLGWTGMLWGIAYAAGFVATRFAGPFNPPLYAHLYTAAVGSFSCPAELARRRASLLRPSQGGSSDLAQARPGRCGRQYARLRRMDGRDRSA